MGRRAAPSPGKGPRARGTPTSSPSRRRVSGPSAREPQTSRSSSRPAAGELARRLAVEQRAGDVRARAPHEPVEGRPRRARAPSSRRLAVVSPARVGGPRARGLEDREHRQVGPRGRRRRRGPARRRPATRAIRRSRRRCSRSGHRARRSGRRDQHRARRPVQRGQRDVAGEDAADRSAMRRPHDDQRGLVALGREVQRAGRRPPAGGSSARTPTASSAGHARASASASAQRIAGDAARAGRRRRR